MQTLSMLAAAAGGVPLAGCAATETLQDTAEDETRLRGPAAKNAAAFNAEGAPALARTVTVDFERHGADGTHPEGRARFQQMEEDSIRRARGRQVEADAAATGYVSWIDARHAVAPAGPARWQACRSAPPARARGSSSARRPPMATGR